MSTINSLKAFWFYVGMLLLAIGMLSIPLVGQHVQDIYLGNMLISGAVCMAGTGLLVIGYNENSEWRATLLIPGYLFLAISALMALGTQMANWKMLGSMTY